MEQNQDLPPFANAPAAEISEEAELAYVLIGEILTIEDIAGVKTHHLMVGQEMTRPIEEELLPVYVFFSKPRSEHQAHEWLDWAGAPSGFLKDVVKAGLLVCIDAKTSWSAAKSLRGLLIGTDAKPGKSDHRGYVPLISPYSGEDVFTINPNLAYVLWGNNKRHDIPTVIKKLARVSGFNKEIIARQILASIPRLLTYSLVRIERQHV